MHKTRIDRQIEAIERQERRNALSTTDQLQRIRLRDYLNGRGGTSADEETRLLRMRALESTRR
jgi:hypothetical protein